MAKRGDARKAAGAAAAAMLTFRKYLENRGKTLSSTPEFLQYYALPYVPNPTEHPSFKQIFKAKWPKDIRMRLERFLDVILESVTLPELYTAFAATKDVLRENRGVSSDDVRRIEERLKTTFMTREENLKNFARNIYTVSVEMVRELERARGGQPVRAEFLSFVQSRLEMFGEALSGQKARSLGKKVGAAVSGVDNAPKSVDFQAARNDLAKLSDLCAQEKSPSLVKESAKKCSRLLQALRWKLNRTRPRAARKKVLEEYVVSDVLGCAAQTTGSAAPDLLLRMLETLDSPIVKEYACRLVNALASDSDGRTYLLQHKRLILMLINVLKSDDRDSFARQNALGALQKFSLRRKAQTIMIEHDLILWLSTILREHTDPNLPNVELSEYTVEYATALLMNLSVRTLGKIKCEDPKVRILDSMNNLLESENSQVRSYVNGTLYSVLSRPVLRERALEMGMDEMMKELMKDGDDDFRHQVKYILEQLQSENTSEEVSEGEEENDEDDPDDDDEEEDDLDEDEDEGDNLEPPRPGELIGDDLLNSLYGDSSTGTALQSTGGRSARRSPPRAAAKESKSDQENPSSTVDMNDSGDYDEDMGSTLTKAEEARNRNAADENFQSRPKIPRTPQMGGTGAAEPGEFDAPMNDDTVSPGMDAKRGVRYNKGDAANEPEYVEGFGDRPKINRTPNTSLYSLPGEFKQPEYTRK